MSGVGVCGGLNRNTKLKNQVNPLVLTFDGDYQANRHALIEHLLGNVGPRLNDGCPLHWQVGDYLSLSSDLEHLIRLIKCPGHRAGNGAGHGLPRTPLSLSTALTKSFRGNEPV